MKKLLFLLLFFSVFAFSQVITDSILGKPKFVKEYVVFLNDSESFKLFSNDGDYGHGVAVDNNALRSSMEGSWFRSDICRYVNNETYFDKNGKIVEDKWFFKDGRLKSHHFYKYDKFGRLTFENWESYRSTTQYYFSKDEFEPIYRKFINIGDNGEREITIQNLENFKFLEFTKSDLVKKIDSTFRYLNSNGDEIRRTSDDEEDDNEIKSKVLFRVNTFDDKYRVIEQKIFRNFNNSIILNKHTRFEFDTKGNIIKEINFNDSDYFSYSISSSGKIIEKIEKEDTERNYFIEKEFSSDNKLIRETWFWEKIINHKVRYEYNDNLISKLYYFDSWGKEKNDIKPSIITFKYKFDKHKNWIECTKNVDGKDLYLWKREIQYY